MKSNQKRIEFNELQNGKNRNFKSIIEDLDEKDVPLMTELDEYLDDIQFKETKSKGSIKIKDIQNIIYGGMSSRFWMLRKHIISIGKEDFETVPFNSWNCLTLQMSNRDIDLVIRNDDEMEKVLKFLIYNMKTLDGSKNSALKLIKAMREEKVKQLYVCPVRKTHDKKKEVEIDKEVEFIIFQKVFFKYKILKIR
jgi:hypothetical protein